MFYLKISRYIYIWKVGERKLKGRNLKVTCMHVCSQKLYKPAPNLNHIQLPCHLTIWRAQGIKTSQPNSNRIILFFLLSCLIIWSTQEQWTLRTKRTWEIPKSNQNQVLPRLSLSTNFSECSSTTSCTAYHTSTPLEPVIINNSTYYFF